MGDSHVDQQLVEQVQRGDKKAFDLLVQKYQHRLVKLISRYVHDSDEVFDVAQEAFIKAYRALPSFRGESAFYTWLYRIGVNTAKNYLIAQGRRPPGVDIDAHDAEYIDGGTELKDMATPDRIYDRDEVERVVISAIERLPKELRDAIMMRELEGLSYDEIAKRMNCPVGTVRSRIFRARDAIQTKLEPLLD